MPGPKSRMKNTEGLPIERKTMGKVIYTGLFLDDVSKSLLIDTITKQCGRLHERVLAHHMTLKFKPNESDIKDLPFGQVYSFRALAVAANDKAQAVFCTVPGGLICSNTYPHITVSVANMVSPAYSNSLLDQGTIKLDNQITLSARLGYFDGKGDRFTLE